MVVALLVGLVAGLIATGLVIADTVRRRLPARTQAGWIGFVALVSLGGSLAAPVLDSAFYRVALAVEPTAVTTTPLQMLAARVGIRLLLSALGVVAYGIGSRYGPFKSAAEPGRQPSSPQETAN
jgi:hypothetical protein